MRAHYRFVFLAVLTLVNTAHAKSKAKVFATIAAGGSASRFHPGDKLTQRLDQGQAIIVATVLRNAPVIPPEQQLLVTNAQMAKGLMRLLKGLLPETHCVTERARRDTGFACAAGLAVHQQRADKDAIAVFLPADHVITPRDRYAASLQALVDAVAGGKAELGAIGIQPRGADGQLGHLIYGDTIAEGLRHVREFREKPGEQVAEQLWQEHGAAGLGHNGGIYVMKIAPMIARLRHIVPEGMAALLEAAEHHPLAVGDFSRLKQHEQALQRATEIWPEDKRISLDHLVVTAMADEGLLIAKQADFDWLDAGSHAQAYNALAGPKSVPGENRGSGPITGGGRGNLVLTDGDSDVLRTESGVHDLALHVEGGHIAIWPLKGDLADTKRIVQSLPAAFFGAPAPETAGQQVTIADGRNSGLARAFFGADDASGNRVHAPGYSVVIGPGIEGVDLSVTESDGSRQVTLGLAHD